MATKVKAKKTKYTDMLFSKAEISSNVRHGETVYEVIVVRKFKAQYNDKGNLVIPQEGK